MILSYKAATHATPFQQFVCVAVVAIVGMVVLRLLSSSSDLEWFWGCVSLGFFTWTNAILGFFRRQHWGRYVAHSVGFFALLTLVVYVAATLTARVGILQLPHYLTSFVATVIFYIVGNLVVAIIRFACELIGLDLFED